MSVALLHSAVSDRRFAGLVLEDMPVSYAAIARQPIHRKIFEAVIPGVLREYDLPGLAAAMAPKPVCLLDARSPTGHVMLRHTVEEEYQFASETYQAVGHSEAFTVRLRREGEGLLDAAPSSVSPGIPISARR